MQYRIEPRTENSSMRLNLKQIFPILNLSSVDYSPPGIPQNGSVTNYTGTTNSSMAFYSCNQGLVPEGRMMAVCTGNGWSPNPADLNCAIGTYVVYSDCIEHWYTRIAHLYL